MTIAKKIREGIKKQGGRTKIICMGPNGIIPSIDHLISKMGGESLKDVLGNINEPVVEKKNVDDNGPISLLEAIFKDDISLDDVLAYKISKLKQMAKSNDKKPKVTNLDNLVKLILEGRVDLFEKVLNSKISRAIEEVKSNHSSVLIYEFIDNIVNGLLNIEEFTTLYELTTKMLDDVPNFREYKNQEEFMELILATIRNTTKPNSNDDEVIKEFIDYIITLVFYKLDITEDLDEASVNVVYSNTLENQWDVILNSLGDVKGELFSCLSEVNFIDHMIEFFPTNINKLVKHNIDAMTKSSKK